MDNEQKWQRLSKFSILFFVFKQLKGFINIAPAFLFAGFSLRDNIDFNSPYFLLAIAGFFALIIISATISYLHYYYIQEDDRFLVRQGFIFKKKVELPFARIQNINLTRPFYYRFLDLTILKMDSAGSVNNEINLAALTLEQSEKIKQDIQRYISKESNQEFIQENEGDLPSTLDLEGISNQVYKEQFSNVTVLNTRSLSDIIINGITNNRAWIILAALAPFSNRVIEKAFNLSNSLGFDAQSYLEQSSLLMMGILAIGIFLFLTFLFSLLSVLGSIFSFYQFTLTYTQRNKSYSRSSGLLTKYEIHLKQSRVQLLRWSQNWLDKLFNRLNMKFEPFSENQPGQANEFFGKIMVPSIHKSEFKQIANHCFADLNFDETKVNPAHIYTYIRSIYWTSLPFSILLLAFLLISQTGFTFSISLAAGLFVFLNLVNFQGYRRAGYLELDQYIVLRKGFIGVSYAIFPKYKIQQIRKHQSYWLKKRKLASVKFVLASGTVSSAILPEGIVDNMVNESLFESQCDERSWM